jgi:hypothetical protein
LKKFAFLAHLVLGLRTGGFSIDSACQAPGCITLEELRKLAMEKQPKRASGIAGFTIAYRKFLTSIIRVCRDGEVCVFLSTT